MPTVSDGHTDDGILDPDDSWGELLVQLGPDVAALVRAADEVVRRTDPDVVRVVWPHQRTVERLAALGRS